MARPSEYDYLKKYKGHDIIYALYTDRGGVRYVGYSKNVYKRFLNHLQNSEYDTNIHKHNWINKNKGLVKIKILSVNPDDWEKEEIIQIKKHKNLINICSGGKNNIHKKDFKDLTDREHLHQANKAIRELNSFNKKRGNNMFLKPLTREEINNICNGST